MWTRLVDMKRRFSVQLEFPGWEPSRDTHLLKCPHSDLDQGMDLWDLML